MKRIDTRLEQLESKAAARSMPRHFCNCPPEIITKPAVTADKLPQEQNTATRRATAGTCHRCGGVFTKEHPAPPTVILQPVKARKAPEQ